MKKTNAMRILDALNIEYESTEYEDDGEHELAKGAALRMAEKLGVMPETRDIRYTACFETPMTCATCSARINSG